MTYLNDLLHRLRLSIGWVAAQFWAMLLLALAGLAWTRLPDKYAWQVLLSLLLPLVLVAAALLLQAGTMRRLLGQEDRRVRLAWGALTLLAWAVVVWAAWAILDWCGDELYAWAAYLNSKAPAHWRASVFTYPHLVRWFTLLVWICRWIVVPGKVIPYALDSATSGWRLRVRRDLRVLWNWRWWLAVVLAALAGVLLPSHLFAGLPHGTVHHQVWAVILKLAATYLHVVCSWVLLVAWGAVLLARQPQPADDAFDADLFRRLHASWRWIAAQFGWMLVWIWINVEVLYIPGVQRWPVWLSEGLGVSYRIFITIAALVVQAEMLRSLMGNNAKRVRLVWGSLALLSWGILYLVAAEMQDYLPDQILQWLLAWVVTPAIFFPFAAASSAWGFRLPWRRILHVLCAWRWWLGVFLAGTFGKLAELYFDGVRNYPYVWKVDLATGLNMGAIDMLEMGVWILLLGWLAVLFDRSERGIKSSGEDSAPLPQSESGDDIGGNA